MRLHYGVVGEGMGHATRSRVILEHLLARGHEVRVLASGRVLSGTGAMRLDLGGLAGGVYLVRLDAGAAVLPTYFHRVGR